MIIDLILDRQDGEEYNAREFFARINEYNEIWPEICRPILDAMYYHTDNDVRRELCNYIDNNGYNPKIKDYINSVNWIKRGVLKYRIWHNIGRAKYVVDFHNGQKMYKDGSDFWDIAIFSNKKAFDKYIMNLKRAGYSYSY